MSLYPTVKFILRDHSGEYGSFELPFEGDSATEHDGLVATLIPELQAALDTITLGNIAGSEMAGVVYTDVASLPSDVWAQREIKALFCFVDTVTGRQMKVTVPAANLNLVAQFGTDVIDHTGNALAAAFVLAVETHAISKDGNPLEIQSATLIGVNN